MILMKNSLISLIAVAALIAGCTDDSKVKWPLNGMSIPKDKVGEHCKDLKQNINEANTKGIGYTEKRDSLDLAIEICGDAGFKFSKEMIQLNKGLVKCDKTIEAINYANQIEMEFGTSGIEFGQLLVGCSSKGRDKINVLLSANKSIIENARK